MAISRKEIEHIASLARLDSTGGIFDRLADDMRVSSNGGQAG
ncbi:MAG: hypothetical protein ACLTGV_07490 [Butyricicoccus sp.]